MIENTFGVANKGLNVTIKNIVSKQVPAPVMSAESAANLAAWLLVRSGVSAEDFQTLVQEATATQAAEPTEP
jgi:hypothetical protein